ncbi:uncharacterized protein LOC117302706 [Asterias rubens]|uniref:uncharacterized protein LOC117302706 n=1 Tax=Asterias rubens TaxID=7604 RepID=UPI001455995E|nr:uncharacterized protein LOC117302706 [Asterias rubens]
MLRSKRSQCKRALFVVLAAWLLFVFLLSFPATQDANSRGIKPWIQWGKDSWEKFKLSTSFSTFLCDSSGTRNLQNSASGCYLSEKLSCSKLPTLHSAFVESTRDEVVFVGVRSYEDDWDAERYICEFPNGEMSITDPIVKDFLSFGGYPQYLIIITCPVPHHFMTQVKQHTIGRFRVNFRLLSNPEYAYMGVPVCLTEKEQRFLSLCTMVKDMSKFIPDWMYYYKKLGVEHVYIYDNDPNATMSGDLEGYIESGFLTIIPWAHTPSPNKTYLEVQIAHENDCLWRHRHNTHWMLKVDVDEFVQPMDPVRTKITDYLQDPYLSSLGTVRIRNWFFGRPPYAKKKVVEAKTVFERNPWRTPSATKENRGRDKCIIRPINVHYFKIHGVKVGSDTLTLDPESELRLVHYRKDNPRHEGFRMHQFVKDESMIDMWSEMTGGRVVSPEWFTLH